VPGLELTVDGAGDNCPGVDEAVAIVCGRDIWRVGVLRAALTWMMEQRDAEDTARLEDGFAHAVVQPEGNIGSRGHGGLGSRHALSETTAPTDA
jgi:hypothetical protein